MSPFSLVYDHRYPFYFYNQLRFVWVPNLHALAVIILRRKGLDNIHTFLKICTLNILRVKNTILNVYLVQHARKVLLTTDYVEYRVRDYRLRWNKPTVWTVAYPTRVLSQIYVNIYVNINANIMEIK